MQENNIKVSVVMPVYNSGQYLETAVNSILSQSFKDFELILVDDGSTDGSSEICDNYGLIDTRVVVIHQNNKGICNARNTAIGVARGEYIAFCDHDDEYLPGLLENVFNRAQCEGADFVKFCNIEYKLVDGVVVYSKGTVLDDCSYLGEDIKRHFLRLMNMRVFECVWDAMFRRQFILDNKLFFDEKYKVGGEDIDYIARVLTKASLFSTMKDVYYVHYVRSGFSTSAKFDSRKLEMCKSLASRIYDAVNELNICIDDFQVEYVSQIMYTLFNSSADLLVKPQCGIRWRDKIVLIKELAREKCITDWFFNVDAIKIFRKSHKLSISYCLYRLKMYYCYLLLFKVHQLQFYIKYKISSLLGGVNGTIRNDIILKR